MMLDDPKTGNKAEVTAPMLAKIGKDAKEITEQATALLRGGRPTPALKPAVKAAVDKWGLRDTRKVVWAYAMDPAFVRGERADNFPAPSLKMVLGVFDEFGFKRGLQLFAEGWEVVK